MRTLVIILAGFAVWGACLGIARLAPWTGNSSMTMATIAFAVIWFIAAAVNMWIGVAQAGYGFMEELPIFLAIFLAPVAVSVFVKWKLL